MTCTKQEKQNEGQHETMEEAPRLLTQLPPEPPEPPDPEAARTMAVEALAEMVTVEQSTTCHGTRKKVEARGGSLSKSGQIFHLMGSTHMWRKQRWGLDEGKSILKIMGQAQNDGNTQDAMEGPRGLMGFTLRTVGNGALTLALESSHLLAVQLGITATGKEKRISIGGAHLNISDSSPTILLSADVYPKAKGAFAKHGVGFSCGKGIFVRLSFKLP